ncbi:MAG: hypothetical protein M4579_005221 [Chaenotheca gracillima]|nr:MAG: hypothetical protein M4579_005221 [Chaenotheca gracillima]
MADLLSNFHRTFDRSVDVFCVYAPFIAIPLLSQVWATMRNQVFKQVFCSVRVSSGDTLFFDIEEWLQQNHLKDFQNNNAELFYDDTGMQTQNEDAVEGKFGYRLPRGGGCWILHHWMPFLIQKNEPLKKKAVLHISISGFRWSPVTVSDILNDARTEASRKKSEETRVYCIQDGQWRLLRSQPARSLKNVIHKDLVEISHLVETSLLRTTYQRLAKRDVSCRLGLLFHGPPGTGKTTLARAIAGTFALDIFLLSLKHAKLEDAEFHALLASIPPKNLILIEDIDRYIEVTDPDVKCRKGGISFSGLLNSLDGIVSPERTITVLTANDKKKLDTSLIRVGRIDHAFEFRKASKQDIEKIFSKLCAPDEQSSAAVFPMDKLTEEFAAMVQADRYTVAELEGILKKDIGEPRRAVKRAKKWTKDHLA